METLIALFQEVKDADHPVLLHIHTQKSHGIPFMEENCEAFHTDGPYDAQTGQYLGSNAGASYNSVAADLLLEKWLKTQPLSL